MIPRIEVIIYIIFIFVLLALTYSREQISSQLSACSKRVLEYQQQLLRLTVDSEATEQRYDDANREAQIRAQAAEEETRRILKMKVPKDCDKAMQWGIDEAHKFNTH